MLVLSWAVHGWAVVGPGLQTRTGEIKGADYVQFFLLGSLLNEDGVAILSGFAPDEIDPIVAAWPGWLVRADKREGDWAALMLGRM